MKPLGTGRIAVAAEGAMRPAAVRGATVVAIDACTAPSAPQSPVASTSVPGAAANGGDFCQSRPSEDLAEAVQDVQAGLDAFLSTVVKLAGARAGAIRSLLSPDGDQMRLVAAVGLSPEVREREELVGACGVCGEALRGDRVRVAENAARCGRLAGNELFGPGKAGTVAVPLEFRGKTVGVFTLFFSTVNEMRAEVIHLLRPMGQLLGLTLENARLQRAKLETELMRERQAMAAELHDSLAQSLTFVRMRMPLLRHAAGRGEAERALGYCADIDDELEVGNRRLRELITHFRVGMDGHGLVAALERLAESFEKRTGIALRIEASRVALSAERELQVFNIVQEALANVFKHSGARNARVTIDQGSEVLGVAIEDDGTGLPQRLFADGADAGGGFGLRIMGERARNIGGLLSLENLAAGGARVHLRIPTGASPSTVGEND